MSIAQFHPKIKDNDKIGSDPEALLDLVMARASLICLLNKNIAGVLEWIDFGRYSVCQAS